jgi:hypothetical protein
MRQSKPLLFKPMMTSLNTTSQAIPSYPNVSIGGRAVTDPDTAFEVIGTAEASIGERFMQWLLNLVAWAVRIRRMVGEAGHQSIPLLPITPIPAKVDLSGISLSVRAAANLVWCVPALINGVEGVSNISQQV